MLSFLSEFADGHHHAKEEKILFPAMEQAGFPMAERAIQRPEQLRVDEEFDSYESGAQEVRSGQQRELERVASTLGT